MHDGYYTVCFNQGNGREHRTFRLATQDSNARFAPGKQIISYLYGSDNTGDYKGLGFVLGTDNEPVFAPWKRMAIDNRNDVIIRCATMLVTGNIADKASKMYARESGNCYVCNRLLTEPDSIELGIGPVCRERLGL